MRAYQSMKRVVQLGSRYPQQVAIVRVAVGIWLLFLAIIFASGRSTSQWVGLFVVVAALNFCLAYRLFRVARRDSGRRMRLQ